MKCPVCRDNLLVAVTLEMEMPVYRCDRCEGVWIPANDYLAWLKTNATNGSHKPADDVSAPASDIPSPKFCPACKRIMRRYKVLPNVGFYLDHCSHCNGVWCDKDELTALLAHNLQDKINLIFMREWQTRLNEEETKTALGKMYLEKFGAADYARVKEIWSWLIGHPKRAMLLAYLQAENPYKM
jgi:Zn-finger nucleic acid-binding protein